MVASHLHSLCHNSHLVECIVLIKVRQLLLLLLLLLLQVGEGWLQVDDKDMLGELVLGSSSEALRKVGVMVLLTSS